MLRTRLERTMTRIEKLGVLAVLVVVGCGSPIDDKSSKKAANQTTTQNNTTSSMTTGETTMTVVPSCGDGVLDAGELCDPGITSGAGACPQSCAAPACATASMVGSAATCTAQCITTPLACVGGDGCCGDGCDASTDNDCQNSCGDGVIDGPETCDGNCPTSCGDDNACTTDQLVGSTSQCNARCSFEPVITCVSGDGCCPTGCDSTRDNDCAPTEFCGNGVVDDGETCDGNCPATCNDQNACTTDVRMGNAAMCDVQCRNSPVSACMNADGCCPAGCTFQNDNDCACIPKTCAQLGAECGTINNGCGGTVTCTDTCNSIEVCGAQNKCVAENFIGADCVDYPQCGSSEDAVCILPPGWPGGYCSILCNSNTGNTLCPSGSHCADFNGTDSLCLLNCTSSAQCEAGYECRQWDGVGGMECVPPQAQPGVGEVGDPCQDNSDCNGTLVCETSVGSAPNIVTLPGGVCTESCFIIIGQCPVNSTCTLDSICMPTCATSADCRAGYSCTGLGLPSGELYCWPS